MPNVVMKMLLSTAATSMKPAGRTRYALAPTPRYSDVFEPSLMPMRVLGTRSTPESSPAVAVRLTSAMWNMTMPSEPGPRLVTVIVSVTDPDGPPPSSIRIDSTAEKPRAFTFVHVIVAVSPE